MSWYGGGVARQQRLRRCGEWSHPAPIAPQRDRVGVRQVLYERFGGGRRGSAALVCIAQPVLPAVPAGRSPSYGLDRLRPAELSVRLPRLDGNMEAPIHEGRRGGAISDG